MIPASKYLPAILLLEFALALALRTHSLNERPMHADEAVQALKFGQLLETGHYEYDPEHFHGPTLYYSTLPIAWLRNQENLKEIDEHTVRLVSAIFGSLLLLSLFWLRDGLGPIGTVSTGALMAVSPAMVYYSRYYIQESILITFTAGMLACGWRYTRTPKLTWAVGTGGFAGLLHATKESSLIVFLAVATALVICRLSKNRSQTLDSTTFNLTKRQVLLHHGLAAFVLAALISATFYSSFLTNLPGIPDSLLSPFIYSLEQGHEKSFYYYLKLLIGLEGGLGVFSSEFSIFALAIVGTVMTFGNNGPSESTGQPGRFITYYTLVLFIIYSLIPYKTPWLVLSILLGLVFLAGAGLQGLYDRYQKRLPRLGLIALLFIASILLVRGMYLTNFRFYADARNPYAYVHPNSDVLEIAQRLQNLAEVSPAGRQMQIKVISEEYWPLPWYLRRFENIGYWNELPANPDSLVIIVSTKLQEALDAKLLKKYQTEYRGLRPGVILLIYVEKELWNRYIAEINREL